MKGRSENAPRRSIVTSDLQLIAHIRVADSARGTAVWIRARSVVDINDLHSETQHDDFVFKHLFEQRC
jgi:hypothetical protein